MWKYKYIKAAVGNWWRHTLSIVLEQILIFKKQLFMHQLGEQEIYSQTHLLYIFNFMPDLQLKVP